MDWGSQKNILVFVEQKDGKPVGAGLESLTPARTLAETSGGKVLALLVGKDNTEAEKDTAAFGADQILSVQGDAFGEGCADAFLCALEQMTEKYHPGVILAANTPLSRELTARLCAHKQLGSIQDAVALRMEDNTPVWTVSAYGGTIREDVVPDTVPFAATVRSGAFRKAKAGGAAASVVQETVSVPQDALHTKVLESVKEIAEAVNLEEAKVIVSGGRGMGSKENFALVQQLADVLGGVVGATRPAIESGWISRVHQIGQSGKSVAPALYIACGISGAIQHVSGVVNSGYIVAINSDEDASIFDIADVGIVGDVMQVLPLMIDAIKKRKAG